MKLKILQTIGIIFAIAIFFYALDWAKKPCVHMYANQEWYDINEKSMPLENERAKFLITDGCEVRETFAFLIKYNRFGKPVFLEDKNKLITHWSPMPAPPKK